MKMKMKSRWESAMATTTNYKHLVILLLLLLGSAEGLCLRRVGGNTSNKCSLVGLERLSNVRPFSSYSAALASSDDDNIAEEVIGGLSDARSQARPRKTKFSSTSSPLGSYLLVWISARSLSQLFLLPNEIPGYFLKTRQDVQSIDWLATAFDVGFVGFGAQALLQKSGLLGENRQSILGEGDLPDLGGLEGRITLDAGRERGTWMDENWAASGARLLLPINVRFTREKIDLGFPGEEALGGRYCYRIDVLDDVISFIGSQGEVQVDVEGGCWSTLPITERRADDGGEAKLRFFLDFPREVVRNDVTVPAGRVFFSGVCFSDADAAALEVGEKLLAPSREGVRPGIVGEGGMTIKRNNWQNFWGALGDTDIMLGRYRVDSVR